MLEVVGVMLPRFFAYPLRAAWSASLRFFFAVFSSIGASATPGAATWVLTDDAGGQAVAVEYAELR